MTSHILKKSPIALTYSRIVEGVTESKRSFMFRECPGKSDVTKTVDGDEAK